MKILFRILFSLGILAGLIYLSHRFLINPDTELGRQLHYVFESLFDSEEETKSTSNEQSYSQKDRESPPVQISQTQSQPRNKMVLYRWKDDDGRTQVTDTPPEGRDYKEISYQDPKTLQTAPKPRQLKPNFNTLPQGSGSGSVSSQSTAKATPLPVHCQVKMRDVKRLEKKLDKAKDVVGSIWLQDYCSALSELIQDSCVVPKSEVKYNRYCPVRFKR